MSIQAKVGQMEATADLICKELARKELEPFLMISSLGHAFMRMMAMCGINMRDGQDLIMTLYNKWTGDGKKKGKKNGTKSNS